MNTITYQAEDCNAFPTATQQNDAAFTESGPDGKIPGSGGEESQQHPHEADKCNAKIHYLSRAVAKEHGVIPSAILTGFAYKLRYHKKNFWKDRWWYYDPIEVLRTHRWPYLSDGCLCENIDYLCNQGLLIKDCNNKLSFDHTSWYAVNDDIRDTALSDLVWFDVAVTKRFKDIFPGLIYHNLRYHLREVLKTDPDCPVPYHKLNKARLARELPMSESTAKRWVQALVDAGLLIRHATKRNLYTLADESQYRPIRSSTNAIVSSANAISSSTNGSSANAISSSTNAIVSKVNANSSSANDNTQYETNLKPVRNHSQTDGCVVRESTSSNDVMNDKSFVDHQNTVDAVGSFPLRDTEETDVASVLLYPALLPTSFDQLMHQTKASMVTRQSIEPALYNFIAMHRQDIVDSFIDDHLDAKTISEFWNNEDRDVLVQQLSKSFADYIVGNLTTWHKLPLSKEQLWQLLYYSNLETLVRAYSADDIRSGKYTHTFADQRSDVWHTYCKLWKKLRNNADFTAEHKCKLVKESVAEYNANGLKFSDGETRRDFVQPQASAYKKLTALFETNPHLSASQILHVLRTALEVVYLEEDHDGYDKYWATRQSKHLDKFMNQLERIISELDMFEECPVTEFPQTAKGHR